MSSAGPMSSKIARESGFCLQLRLLLWKNWTIKRRHPFLSLLEVVIPLTLFIVLLCIRRTQFAYPEAEEHYFPEPLPSSGLVPILQTFCKQDGSVYTQANDRLLKFLEELNSYLSENGHVLSAVLEEPSAWLDVLSGLASDDATAEDLLKALDGLPDGVFKLLLPSGTAQEDAMKFLMMTSSCHAQKKLKTYTGTLTEDDSHSAARTVWNVIRPVLCGLDERNSSNPEETKFTPDQQSQLKKIRKIAYNNPKILFAPNNTLAQSVIAKMNESLVWLTTLRRIANVWLGVSGNITLRLNEIKNISTVSPQKKDLASVLNTVHMLDLLSCAWLEMTRNIDFDVFRGFGTEEELEYYFLNRQYHDNVTVLAGLVFQNLEDSMTSLPEHVKYKIRQNATLNPPTNEIRPPFWFPSPGSNNQYYYQFGFVWIQDVVERAVIELQTGLSMLHYGTFLHRMPYPCWLWDQFVWLIQHVLPLCLMLSWVYSVAMLVQRIVYEKEKRLKEVMKMMGLTDAVHWWAWFITAGVQMTLTVVTLTLMLYFGRVLPHSNPVIVFLFLESFALSSVAFSFLISSLYSRAKLAAACAGIFYFVSYIPYMYIAITEDVTGIRIPPAIKTVASIFPTSALGLGGKYFLFYELEGAGAQWENLASSPRERDAFNLMYVLVMTCVDTVVYFVLAWYIENVHPGTYGIPKPWYYPFTSSYWCGMPLTETCSVKRLFGIHKKGGRYSLLSDDDDTEDVNITCDADDSVCECTEECTCRFELEPDALEAKVIISNLYKKYSSQESNALKGLSAKLYEDQITAFLGHNGAGKTTTMSIMTGFFPPTTGSVTIYGYDVRTDMDKIRQDLGMCPQHNVLFDSLTVREHLWFYSRLKGIPVCEINDEIPGILTELGLEGKATVLPGALSGGMQRKLSIAMAFIGGSRTVILDEPTAGVDPYSRRAIWKLITEYKTGRTVMVSTHHMDEAEMLGDRILIIADGRLKCAGSPTFLKHALGDGYRICILKETELEDRNHGDTDHIILSTVKRVASSAYISSSSGSELHIMIPLSSNDRPNFSHIFKEFDTRKAELGIKSYGIADSGLESVFQRVTETSEHKRSSGTMDDRCGGIEGAQNVIYDGTDSINNAERDYMQLRPLADPPAESYRLEQIRKQKRNLKFLSDFKAIMIKRLLYTLRNRKAILSQIILPAVFVSISMTIALTAPKDLDPEPLVMSTAQYSTVMQPRGNFVPFALHTQNTSFDNSSRIANFSKRLAETFLLSAGIGADCATAPDKKDLVNTSDTEKTKSVLFQKPPKGCIRVNFKPINWTQREGTYIHTKNRFYPSCYCKADSVGYMCDRNNTPDPPHWKVATEDILQDVTSRYNDDEQFYLYTTDDYKRHRYGGFTFGTELPFVPPRLKDDNDTSDLLSPNMFGSRTYNKVRYNQNGYHSMPIYLNALNNALLRASLGENTDMSKFGITLTNHPMRRTGNILSSNYIKEGTDVLMSIFIIIAMSFVPASFVVFLVHERAIKAKHLQFSSGLHPVTYWITNFFWDMCNYLIPASCILIILLCFNIEAYVGKGNLEVVIALFLLYGFSITPMMYPASYLFTEPSVAYICLILFNLFTGITCVVTSFMLKQFGFDKSLSSADKVLDNVFVIFPNYCLGNGMMRVALNQYENEYYFDLDEREKMRSPLCWDVAGKRLVVMAVMGVLSFVFTILCEYEFFLGNRLVKRHPKTTTKEQQKLDSDVLVERCNTLSGAGQNKTLSVERLSKVYSVRRKNLTAVEDLCFSVQRGECFGLLGVNGAGKTTTFRMLTGDLAPSSGDAKLLAQSVVKGGRKVQQCVGYCPQFDALFSELTPREHLQLYARLRGIPRKYHQEVIRNCLRKLGLTKYDKQPVGTLSGGNKRKLSTAIALVGNPRLILLDEPTSGMDPYSRKFLWNVIESLVQGGTSVVFTSHSMEECEAVCTRLSIMVKGQLKCLGSVQHLKEKYGDGYTLTIVLASEQHAQTVLEFISSNLVSTRVKYRSQRTLVFDMKISFNQLEEVFETLENLPAHFGVVDYSLSQNTLDNVFVNFASEVEVCNDGDGMTLAKSSDVRNNTSCQDSDDELWLELHNAPEQSEDDTFLIEG